MPFDSQTGSSQGHTAPGDFTYSGHLLNRKRENSDPDQESAYDCLRKAIDELSAVCAINPYGFIRNDAQRLLQKGQEIWNTKLDLRAYSQDQQATVEEANARYLAYGQEYGAFLTLLSQYPTSSMESGSAGEASVPSHMIQQRPSSDLPSQSGGQGDKTSGSGSGSRRVDMHTLAGMTDSQLMDALLNHDPNGTLRQMAEIYWASTKSSAEWARRRIPTDADGAQASMRKWRDDIYYYGYALPAQVKCDREVPGSKRSEVIDAVNGVIAHRVLNGSNRQ